MYTVAVSESFVAEHCLMGGDGPENRPHSHNYRVEVQLEGHKLDEYGYLVDIVVIKENLEALLNQYRNKSLNEAPEFAGLNPSVEHFARIVCEQLLKRIQAPGLESVAVKMWEDESAWAAFRQER